jgi:soluble lytic murein transglycosylase
MRCLIACVVFAAAGAGALLYWTISARNEQQRYDPIIRAVVKDYPVDPLLIRAVIWRESRFDPKVYGLAQERGLMQVTPIAAREWATSAKIANFQDDSLYDPAINIQAGTWYLSRALKRWAHTDNPVPFALAEYNAGRSNALRWVDPQNPKSPALFLERMDFPTTKAYIAAIEQKYYEYKAEYYRPPWMGWWEKIGRRLKSDSQSGG